MNHLRLFPLNVHSPRRQARFVLYWMQIQRRLEFNFALDHAVEWANRLDVPLVILEGLRCDYPWASRRLHSFVLQGMQENAQACGRKGLNYYPFVERSLRQGAGLVRTLARDAALVVTDNFPGFVIRDHNDRMGKALDVPLVAVDSGGIIPLGLSSKAPYSAYEFRRLMQKNFVEAFTRGPQPDALSGLRNKTMIDLKRYRKQWPVTPLENLEELLDSVPVNRDVAPVALPGTRRAALDRLDTFVERDLRNYAELHNHPDLNCTSGLSPYLHFGKISAHEVVAHVLSAQPAGWSLKKIFYNKGSREGFFNGHPSVDAFLDQAITWRETGYHYCHHVRDFDRFESLPDWARRTLEKHAVDRREHVYTLEQFERAETHDPLWNAAQNQLRREGVLHNYLRMLWGKKILEWSPDPRTALSVMIELNNKYALDGRNPNSYTGIFWVLGRFDRPWAPEREIYGTVRYMTSQNTARKVKVKEYLRRYA